MSNKRIINKRSHYEYMKNNLIYIAICLILVWNVWLSLPDEKNTTPINYELFNYQVQQYEARIDTLELQINQYNNEIIKDSIFIYSSARYVRDSLRQLHNPTR